MPLLRLSRGTLVFPRRVDDSLQLPLPPSRYVRTEERAEASICRPTGNSGKYDGVVKPRIRDIIPSD